ncbi:MULTISPECIES: DUF4259 domain-containing protein [unclassified Streptomyces]|uniref:DUF4259 domain-containing protein n=1 Tax=unclassified Streptomyces TaxID=2593676 RepID=UPI002815BA6C|nr:MULTISPECIES: DUF4259 domain-containing protein [unclassified Streptomyces]
MGTWDTGPFDNDTAADFTNALDGAKPEEREALIRGVLTRTVDATGWLTEGEEAGGRSRTDCGAMPWWRPNRHTLRP